VGQVIPNSLHLYAEINSPRTLLTPLEAVFLGSSFFLAPALLYASGVLLGGWLQHKAQRLRIPDHEQPSDEEEKGEREGRTAIWAAVLGATITGALGIISNLLGGNN
jgi:hypothetical protein